MRSNGITRPAQGTATRVIWDVIDSMVVTPGTVPSYPEVIQAVEPHGLKERHINKSVLQWRRFHGATSRGWDLRAKQLRMPDNNDVYLGGL